MNKKRYIVLIVILSFILLVTLSIYAFMNNKIDIFVYVLIVLSVAILSFTLNLILNARKNEEIRSLKDKLYAWNNISVHLKDVSEYIFENLPIGIILYNENYNITWANMYAKEVFNSRLDDRSLDSLIDEFSNQIESNDDTFTVEFRKMKFDVHLEKSNRALYLFDVTKREDLYKRFLDKRVALGIISIDNLDESLKNLDINVKEEAVIRGQFLGKISEWANSYNSYLRVLDDDQLVLLCDYSSLKNMINNGFDVLKQVRDVAKEYKILVTLSIGIACYDLEYEKLGDIAQKAIDMAEKRGGDQAVINIQNEPIKYFGGTTENFETRTMVSVRREAAALKTFVSSCSKLFIMSHMLADTDAFGSLIGASKFGLSLNKDTYILYEYEKLDKTTKKIFDMLKEDETYQGNFLKISDLDKYIDEDSALLVVDTQSPNLMMDRSVLIKFNHIGVIDHHRRGELFFENIEYVYMETSSSSTVELITEIFNFYQKITLTPMEATIMLAGIVVDTNNFTYRTTERTFDVVKELKRYGADMIKIRALLRDNKDDQIIISKNVSKVDVVFKHFAIVKVEDEIIEDRTMLAKISEKTLDIENIKASFTIAKIDENTVGISARSYNDLNVQIIMEELGGGGHLNSAAAQLKEVTVAEVYNRLYEILRREYEEDGEEKMKVILLEDVKGKGKKNQIIEVANGYGNFLLANNKAVIASAENVKNVEKAIEIEKQNEETKKEFLLKLKHDIEALSVNVFIKVGNDGKVFGNITTKQIGEELYKQHAIDIDKRKISLPSDINSVGIYDAIIHLGKDINAKIRLNVLEK